MYHHCASLSQLLVSYRHLHALFAYFSEAVIHFCLRMFGMSFAAVRAYPLHAVTSTLVGFVVTVRPHRVQVAVKVHNSLSPSHSQLL